MPKSVRQSKERAPQGCTPNERRSNGCTPKAYPSLRSSIPPSRPVPSFIGPSFSQSLTTLGLSHQQPTPVITTPVIDNPRQSSTTATTPVVDNPRQSSTTDASHRQNTPVNNRHQNRKAPQQYPSLNIEDYLNLTIYLGYNTTLSLKVIEDSRSAYIHPIK